MKTYPNKKTECSHDDIDVGEYGSRDCKLCGASGYEMNSGEYEN